MDISKKADEIVDQAIGYGFAGTRAQILNLVADALAEQTQKLDSMTYQKNLHEAQLGETQKQLAKALAEVERLKFELDIQKTGGALLGEDRERAIEQRKAAELQNDETKRLLADKTVALMRILGAFKRGTPPGHKFCDCAKCDDLYRACQTVNPYEMPSVAEARADALTNALNKIHDLAGQMGDVHPHVGAIQALVHEVSPCAERRKHEYFCVRCRTVTPENVPCPKCEGSEKRVEASCYCKLSKPAMCAFCAAKSHEPE